MPYFFYKSGVYYRQVTNYQCVIGGKLLLLFVKYSFIAYLIYCCILFITDDFSITNAVKMPIKQLLLNGTLNSNLPLWFLTTFFAAKVLYNWFRNKGVKNIAILFLFEILTLSLFYFSLIGPEWVSFPKYVYSISGAIFFISVGNQLKSIQFNKWAIILATIGYCVIAIFSHSRVDMFENELIEGRYELWMLSSILGIIVFINLFKVIYNSYRFPFLSFINRNALPLFASHWIIYLVVSNLFIEPLSIENSYSKIII